MVRAALTESEATVHQSMGKPLSWRLPRRDYSKHHSVAAGDSRFRIAASSMVTPLI